MGLVADALAHFADDIWENRGRIMTGISCIGTLSTFIFTIRANNKANERRHEAQAEKGEYLTTWERVKAEFPAYIAPGVICSVTIIFNVLNQIDHENQISKLTVALAGLTKLYNDRIRAEKEAGVAEEVNAQLVDYNDIYQDKPRGEALPGDEYQFYHLAGRENNGGFFWARECDILAAEIAINKELQYEHRTNMYMFVKAINSDTLPVEARDDITGWAKWHIPRNSICAPQYISVHKIPMMLSNKNKYGPYTELEFDFDPEPDYNGY